MGVLKRKARHDGRGFSMRTLNTLIVAPHRAGCKGRRLDDWKLSGLQPGDQRNLLSEDARRRLDRAHLEAERIRLQAEYEIQTEALDPSGFTAQRKRKKATFDAAREVLKTLSQEYGALNLGFHKFRECLDEEIEGATNSLELSALERQLLEKEFFFPPAEELPEPLPQPISESARAFKQVVYEKKLEFWRGTPISANRSAESPPSPPTISPEVEVSGKSSQQDPIAAERTNLLNSFKRKGRSSGLRITDEMVAKAAKDTWNERTMVTWWKRNDKRCKPPHDRLIRAVLSRDPASIWPPPT
jgi:hypothetical protein